jgi:hypothetical protein
MEKLEKQMLMTIAQNLNHCADLPDEYDEPEELDNTELLNLVKNVRKLVKDNVAMINTIVTHGSGPEKSEDIKLT